MEEIIENKLTEDGYRQIKLVCDVAVKEQRMMRFIPAAARVHAQIRCYDTSALSLFYGEARWPVRGEIVDVYFEGLEIKRFRRLVAWKIMPGERMSEEIAKARCAFIDLFARWPQYAFTRTLPKSVESGIEVEDVMLMQAEWALPGCLLIGG